MSEDALIRFDNLIAYCAARDWGPTELALAIGRKVNQCSDMLRRKKSFGEKVARHIEDKVGLPRGWLDEPHEKKEVLAAAKSVAQTSTAYDRTPHLTTLSAGEQTPSFKGNPAEIRALAPLNSATNTGWAPVVEWARLGVDLHKTNEQLREYESRGYSIRGPVSQNAKWVQVHGSALAPLVLDGDMLLVDPDKVTPTRDQVVLLQSIDGEYLLMRYRPVADANDFEVYDERGRTLSKMRHGLELKGTAVTLQRDVAF